MRRFLVGAVMACVVAANAVWSPSPLDAHTYHSGVWALHGSIHTTYMDRVVHMVPAGASVSASYTAVPHLTHRTHIYEWPTPWVRGYYGLGDGDPLPDPATVQYLVLDLGLNPQEAPLVQQLTAPGGEFEVLFDADNVLLARRVARPATISGG